VGSVDLGNGLLNLRHLPIRLHRFRFGFEAAAHANSKKSLPARAGDRFMHRFEQSSFENVLTH
jgi:hypothetical protein